MYSKWYVFNFIIYISRLMWIFYKTDQFLNHQPNVPPSVFIIVLQSKVSDVINENGTECKYGQQYYQMIEILLSLWFMNRRNAHVLIMHHNYVSLIFNQCDITITLGIVYHKCEPFPPLTEKFRGIKFALSIMKSNY